MAFDHRYHFQEPFERLVEDLRTAPDDLGCLEESFQKRLDMYRKERERERGWICEYCGSTQPSMDSHCRECGAPRE